MKVGEQYLMIEPAKDSTIARGQVGTIIDQGNHPETLFLFEWDDGTRTWFPFGEGGGGQIVKVHHELVCDFCNSNGVAWTCRAAGRADVIVSTSRGTLRETDESDWLACHPCKRLIEARQVDRLFERSRKRHTRAHPELSRKLLGAGIRDAHTIFWARFTGEIEPFG